MGGLVGAQFLVNPGASAREVPLFAALGIIFAAGLADDLRGLSPYIRLFAQVLAASIVWLGGWHAPIALSGAANFIVTIFFLLTFANALNFFDGADGLAAGVAAIAAGVCAVLPATHYFGPRYTPGFENSVWAITGASLAFLCFNFPPARVFLGDSGSTMLGFALGSLMLDPPSSHSQASIRLFVLPMAAALPLVDLGFSVVRRARIGQSPFFGDRRHIYDLLLRRGWTVRRTALTIYGITALLALCGCLGLRAGQALFAIASALALGVLGWTGSRLGALRMSDDSSTMPRRELQLNRGDGSSG
jgi:UDP-GlcNAc:undecaprenyl-phosphate/decaprenyl-phosphate GlcNAc-1-phosphate transferase